MLSPWRAHHRKARSYPVCVCVCECLSTFLCRQLGLGPVVEWRRLLKLFMTSHDGRCIKWYLFPTTMARLPERAHAAHAAPSNHKYNGRGARNASGVRSAGHNIRQMNPNKYAQCTWWFEWHHFPIASNVLSHACASKSGRSYLPLATCSTRNFSCKDAGVNKDSLPIDWQVYGHFQKATLYSLLPETVRPMAFTCDHSPMNLTS